MAVRNGAPPEGVVLWQGSRRLTAAGFVVIMARNKFKVAKSDRPKIERPTGNRPVLDRFVAMRDSLKWRRSPSDSDFQVSAFRFQVGARPKGLALRKEWLVLLALARAARTMVKNEKR